MRIKKLRINITIQSNMLRFAKFPENRLESRKTLVYTKVFHRIIDTVSKNTLDLELFFDYDLKPLSY